MLNSEKYKKYYEYLNHNPAKFIEELYGIKLLPFQKVIVNAMYKEKQISYRCNSYYKYQKLVYALLIST